NFSLARLAVISVPYLSRGEVQQGSRVALESRKLRALHGAAAITLGVSLRCQLQHFAERHVHVSLARQKPWLVSYLLKAIPGTNILTNVAAIKPTLKVSGNRLGQLLVAQFDRRVG